MISFNNILFPEAMSFILKAMQTVVSGLLRLKLQIKCESFSKLTYLLLFWVWFEWVTTKRRPKTKDLRCKTLICLPLLGVIILKIRIT